MMARLFPTLMIAAALFVGSTDRAAAQGPTAVWTRVSSAAPPARHDYALTYDDLRRVTVLFGGRRPDGARLSDTWEFDGDRWRPVSVSGPPGRDLARMVFDSERAVCLLFGGFDSSGGALNDTWEYDGVSWRLVATGGPAPRGAFGFAFDSEAGAAVLFGGWDGAPIRDSWTWDGVGWSPMAGPLPDLQYDLDMCFDVARRVCVLTGTREDTRDPDPIDVWEWDGSAWREAWAGDLSGPFAGVGHGLSYDAVHEVSTLIGWRLRGEFFESATFEWNGSGWADADDAPLRNGQAIAFDLNRGVIVAPGTPEQDVTWRWDGRVWSVRGVGSPPGGGGGALAFDESRDRFVLYGPQVWEFDGDGWMIDAAYGVRVRLAGLPHSNSSVTRFLDRGFAYDPQRMVSVVFGKTCVGGGQTCASFTAEWNGAAWRTLSTGDAPRDAPAMAAIPDVGVVRFGGDGAYDESAGTGSDLWRWDGQRWIEYPLSGARPTPRSRAGMVYDADRSVLVLFGGFSGGGALGDLWEWDGANWAQRDATGPAARFGHNLVYDARAGRTLLFGGQGGESVLSPVYFDDLWSWDGDAWERVSVAGGLSPRARTRAAAAVDALTGEMLLAAGEAGASLPLDDVWIFAFDPGDNVGDDNGGDNDNAANDNSGNGNGGGATPVPCAAGAVAPLALLLCGRRLRAAWRRAAT